ncbi:MAG: hypothetical protein JNN08_13490 [Bryobacterales bacterium]|nr:hypothetical protein [Bryobacterales bacterium]
MESDYIVRFQADADLDYDIVPAVRRREPAVDFASATETALEVRRGSGGAVACQRPDETSSGSSHPYT